MSHTAFLADPDVHALVRVLRAEPGRRAALEIASGWARREAERRQRNQLVADLDPPTLEAGERYYAAIAARFPVHTLDDEQVRAACARHAPALPDLAARHGLPLPSALAAVLALASTAEV